eukprot:6188713-Pleurochrysis_carterae.AAC.2
MRSKQAIGQHALRQTCMRARTTGACCKTTPTRRRVRRARVLGRTSVGSRAAGQRRRTGTPSAAD